MYDCVAVCECMCSIFTYIPIGVEANYCRTLDVGARHTKIPYNQLASWSQQKNVKSNSWRKILVEMAVLTFAARSPGVLLHHRHNRQTRI